MPDEDGEKEIHRMLGQMHDRLIQVQKTGDDTHEMVRTQGVEIAKQGEQIKDAFRQIRERVTKDKHEALARRVEENRAEKADTDRLEALSKDIEGLKATLSKVVWTAISAIIAAMMSLGRMIFSTFSG